LSNDDTFLLIFLQTMDFVTKPELYMSLQY